MRRTFSLDLYLLQHIGLFVDIFTSTFTNQPPFHQVRVGTFHALFQIFVGSFSHMCPFAATLALVRIFRCRLVL